MIIREIVVLSSILFLSTYNFAQQNVSISDISTTPHASSVLDVSSSTKGLLIPRVALTSINVSTPIGSAPLTSLLVYNTATAGTAPNNVTPGYYYWDGTKWCRFDTGNNVGDWKLLGNAGTNASDNFLGTTDNVDLVFRTNNAQRVRINSIGNTGVGVNPLATSGQSILSVSRDGVNACCGGENSTLALAEATTSSGRRPSISFHASGESEGVIHITQESTGIGAIGVNRRLRFFDNQGQGLGLELTGNLWFGNGNSRTQTRSNAGLRGDAGAQSGFFEFNQISGNSQDYNYPSGYSGNTWWHLLDVRHSNAGNNYALQFSGNFFDQELFFRKTNDNPSQPWSRVATNNNNVAWLTTGNVGTNSSINFLGTLDNQDLTVRTNNTEWFRITSSGVIGSGLSTPQNSYYGGTNNIFALNIVRTNVLANTAMAEMVNASANGVSLSVDNFSTTSGFNSLEGIINFNQTGSSPSGILGLSLANTGWGYGMSGVSNSNGGLGLYAQVPSPNTNNIYAIYSFGRVLSTGGYFTTSDANLKTNIKPVQNAISLLSQIEPVYFDFKDEYSKFVEGKNQIGFLAQNIEKVLPMAISDVRLIAKKVVGKKMDNQVESLQSKAVNYEALIPLLTKAIQEQQLIIEELQKRIEILEKK